MYLRIIGVCGIRRRTIRVCIVAEAECVSCSWHEGRELKIFGAFVALQHLDSCGVVLHMVSVLLSEGWQGENMYEGGGTRGRR